MLARSSSVAKHDFLGDLMPRNIAKRWQTTSNSKGNSMTQGFTYHPQAGKKVVELVEHVEGFLPNHLQIVVKCNKDQLFRLDSIASPTGSKVRSLIGLLSPKARHQKIEKKNSFFRQGSC